MKKTESPRFKLYNIMTNNVEAAANGEIKDVPYASYNVIAKTVEEAIEKVKPRLKLASQYVSTAAILHNIDIL
jgi:hypothetical protein